MVFDNSSLFYSKIESPVVEIDLRTPPGECSTPKSQYSDDSLSQDFSPVGDVGWKKKKRPSGTTRRTIKVPKFAKTLAKEQFERNQLERQPLPPEPQLKPGELSVIEKFKLGIKQLEMASKETKTSPKASSTKTEPSFTKHKENVTRSFMFGVSDDSDEADEAYASWNSLIKKFDHLKENKQLPATPTKSSDDNWRKTKSAQELNTSSSSNNKPVLVSEPLKDLFDDSISDSLLYQCTQQVEKKLASTTTNIPIKSTQVDNDNPLDNDSDDDILSSFPLQEIIQKSGLIDSVKKQTSGFSRHNSMPCQSKISSIVK